MPKQALKLKIIGQVQGVFYRSEAQKKALSLGLTGWIKNASDGSVECWAEGDQDKLEEFLEWCWQGPSGARVRNVKVEPVEPQNIFNGFNIVI